MTRNNNELDPCEITAQKRHQPGKLENDTSKAPWNGVTQQAGTHIRGRALVSARAGEGDELMAPLVHDEAANCEEKTETVSGDNEGRAPREPRAAKINSYYV